MSKVEKPKWTPLRHQALRMIANDQVSRGLDPSGWAYTGLGANAKIGHLNRAVDGLINVDCARIVGTWRDPIALTAAGELLLAEWDEKHPATD